MQYFKKVFSTNMSKKVFYPSADRNKQFILDVLQRHFDPSKPGKVLEIASGTGQQAAFFAAQFPNLVFQPSEFEEPLFESIRAYAQEVPSKNVREPALIDIIADPETWNVDNDFDYILNVNMFHVTPFSCAEGFFKNGVKVLKDGGLFVTYGPYAVDGVLEPQSNVDFDRNIRARDPQCGVRDIRDLKKAASAYNVFLKYVYDLPANNKCLVWQKKKAEL